MQKLKVMTMINPSEVLEVIWHCPIVKKIQKCQTSPEKNFLMVCTVSAGDRCSLHIEFTLVIESLDL